MTFNMYLSAASKNWMDSKGILRRGQAFFNVLSSVKPKLAEVVRGGSNDPYYSDMVIDKFLSFVGDNWDNY